MTDPRPTEHTSTLGRDLPCPNCGHSSHLLPCREPVGMDVTCPCRDVAVPGIYPAA